MEQDLPVTPDPRDSESAERAIERLASGWIPQDAAVSDSGDAEIRADLEALALLAYELEPEAPAPAVKERLMAAARASRGDSSPTVDPRSSAVDRTLQHAAMPAAAPEPVTRGLEPADKTLKMELPAGGIPVRPSRSGPSIFGYALAAALALCLVGLGYLYGQVNAKNVVIALQQDRLQSMGETERELERAQDDLRRIHDSLAMVTTVAQKAYPLRPAAGGAQFVDGTIPSGKVFVCGQHQRWYLSMSDLESAPEGFEYHLWFLTEQGVVDAGKFEVRDGAARMQDLSMPDDTAGFQITLEPVGGGDVPAGKTILVGDRPVSL